MCFKYTCNDDNSIGRRKQQKLAYHVVNFLSHHYSVSTSCPIKFRIAQTYFFEDIENSIFLTFGLKSPNDAHFLGVLWGFDTRSEQFFLIETPKRHFWVKPCRLRYRSWKSVHPFCCRWWQEKRERKGRKGKVSHDLGLYFSYMGSGPSWTDFYENWQGWRGPWLNHSVQFWFQYFQGFKISIFPLTLLVIVTTVLPLLRSLWYENLTCTIIHSIKQSRKDMENGHKWSWKVLENAHKMVLESPGKPLWVFCRHRALMMMMMMVWMLLTVADADVNLLAAGSSQVQFTRMINRRLPAAAAAAHN